MTCGVAQGSIIALLLFSLYMLPLCQIMRKNQIGVILETDLADFVWPEENYTISTHYFLV